MTDLNVGVETVGSTESDDIHDRVEGTNIDEVTLLTTDYLNHFNELVMVLEMVPDMPEMFEDAKDWQPLAYVDHFSISGFPHGPLAVEAYEKSPAEFREPFDDTVQQIDAMVLATIEHVASALETGETPALAEFVGQSCIEIRGLIDLASSIVHRRPDETPTVAEAEAGVDADANMDQDAIDSLFD